MVVTYDDIEYDLSGDVPSLSIKGAEVNVLAMTKHYVASDIQLGTDTITFVYRTYTDDKQKILSVNNTTGEVFNR